MKTSNFPGKKNKRRINALARLIGRPDINLTKINILTDRIMPEGVARAIRTKKQRSGKRGN